MYKQSYEIFLMLVDWSNVLQFKLTKKKEIYIHERKSYNFSGTLLKENIHKKAYLWRKKINKAEEKKFW
jgi:hypothetical protein